MMSASTHRRLKNDPIPWGPGPKQQNLATFEECVGLDYDKLGIRDAVQRLDHLLFSFTILINSTKSAPPSKASQNLGVDSLRSICQDCDWVEALLAIHEKKWMTGGFDGKGLALSMGTSITSIHEETSQTAVDFFAMREAEVANIACRYFPGVGPESIKASVQVATPSTGGSVTPDVLFYAHSQGERRLFERREDKTLEAMIHHAHALDALVDCGLDDIKDQQIHGMFTQAYTSSVSTSRCITVWMGHPDLYRIAYIHQRSIYLSH
ncbi:hypothetical protein B0H17DRAFT_662190 [Mycena rosella]|uniref:Uncharacterized protein n=1 Tax=Mycena rosella TaxID=1033263 RepID=A0AAD7GCS8_MYCRO|nr:hypothetical protein B0H17DRAFT_662190 [Mycena rosella]